MKRIINYCMLVAATVFVAVSCDNPAKMAEAADKVSIKCNPEVLEVIAGEIKADVTVDFPADYFCKKGILEVTPVIKYAGKEVAGKPFIYQGGKVNDNYKVVVKNLGATYTEKICFKYEEGMEKCVLVARAVVKAKGKQYKFPNDIKIADGANTTYMLIDKSGSYSLKADGYQEVIPETEEAQILYLINSADVRSSEINSADVKAYKEALKALANDSRREIKGTEIVAYASPDGGEELNSKLSSKRENSAARAFGKATRKINAGDVSTRSIAQDWEGFKELVDNSNIEDKDLIIRVLSMYSDPNVREREIKNMSSVYSSLAQTVLPQLRRARFITSVEYTNYTADELKDLVENNIDVLDEPALLHAATLVKDNAQKLAIYDKAIAKYDSKKAKFNAAVTCLDKNDVAGAERYIAGQNGDCKCMKNLKGVIAMRKGDYAAAEKLFKEAGDAGVENLAVIDVLNGRYADAKAKLAGKGGYNAALVDILNKDYESAHKSIGDCKCPRSSYLKAIVAAREGDTITAQNNLEVASKDDCLAHRAATDVEFAKVK